MTTFTTTELNPMQIPAIFAFACGIGGPVGSGKTALTLNMSKVTIK